MPFITLLITVFKGVREYQTGTWLLLTHKIGNKDDELNEVEVSSEDGSDRDCYETVSVSFTAEHKIISVMKLRKSKDDVTACKFNRFWGLTYFSC